MSNLETTMRWSRYRKAAWKTAKFVLMTCWFFFVIATSLNTQGQPVLMLPLIITIIVIVFKHNLKELK